LCLWQDNANCVEEVQQRTPQDLTQTSKQSRDNTLICKQKKLVIKNTKFALSV